jgi:hypothetical protein
MNEQLKKWYNNLCKKHELDPQQFDIDAHMDRSLSYNENRVLILKKLGIEDDAVEKMKAVNREIRFRGRKEKEIIKELNKEAGIKNSTFILDEKEVFKNKLFAFDVISNDKIGVGFLLPKWFEDRKNGALIRKYQSYSPAIITSNNELIDISDDLELRKLKINYKDIPEELRLRWSLSKIKEFLDENEDKVNKKLIYEKIKSCYESNVYYAFDEWYAVDACWDIGTYFFNLFSSYPIYERRGLKRSGKSKAMMIGRNITFNACDDLLINPSESSLFRETNDKRYTKYIDEAEKLFNFTKQGFESDGRIDIINSSYKKGSSVPRVEKIGNRFKTVYYKTYSPTQIGSIKGLYGATEDRAIVHISTRIPDNDSRGETEIDDSLPIWQEIRNELYLLMFQNWKEIRDVYNELKKIKIDNLKKRQFELWLPILTIAKFIDEEIYKKIVNFAIKVSKIKSIKDHISKSSQEYRICEKVSKLLQISEEILIADIMEIFEGDEKKPYSKTIGRKFDNLGFNDFRDHFSKGNGWRLTQEDFDKIINPIIPSLSSFHSKQENLGITDKNQWSKLNITEEKVK